MERTVGRGEGEYGYGSGSGSSLVRAKGAHKAEQAERGPRRLQSGESGANYGEWRNEVERIAGG